ncbi:hypothetical protein MSP8887_02928 [Marinomonas spartinae]|uniref:Uncharacterized protein n=1 Tax=Marinomonas spartinae TaxID=1792290 RepID=A0A1A8TVP6_9GAMM|nr:hypothetical protein [Marinomonas spartinae]SBS37461.1 hypothetical protein MSP8887_02928 [Marinomonas spartinae]SBS37483.1 hypothetical protein MSP8886_04136 [Marinomonas spartinae]
MSLFKAILIMLLSVPVLSFAQSYNTDYPNSTNSVMAKVTLLQKSKMKLADLVNQLDAMGVDVHQCMHYKQPKTLFEEQMIVRTKIKHLENTLYKLQRARFNYQDMYSSR